MEEQEDWEEDIGENWGERKTLEPKEISEEIDLEQNAGIEDVNWNEQE